MAVIEAQVFLSYNSQHVTGLLYNLYADKMLGLNLVPQSVYTLLVETLERKVTVVVGAGV